MGQIWIREFSGGLDSRRLPEATKGGALILGYDGHINRGAEFEKRAAFVKVGSLPAGTRGLANSSSGLYVFGHAGPPAGLPAGVAYQQLVHPTDSSIALKRLLSFTLSSGKLFVAVEFADGGVFHYYDGTRVTNFFSASFQPGAFVRGLKKKIYGLVGSTFYFSGESAPTDFNTDVAGAGFIDMSTQAEGSETLMAIAPYQQWLAIFAQKAVQIWAIDPDPTKYSQVQVLSNTGTSAPRSVVQFGDNDLFYLDESGVRSLRARDASNAAATTDTGTQIDTLITSDLRALTADQRQNNVMAVIEPRDKRLWMAIRDKIYVFTFFDASKVSAWTVYRPGFVVEDMVVQDRKVYLRSGDDLYVYGGLGDELTYDDTEAEAWLPYLDGDEPAKSKTLTGIDAAVLGTWEVRMGMQPTNLEASDLLGFVSETTFNGPSFGGMGQTTHFSPRLKSTGTGPAVLSSFIIHYVMDKSEG